MTATKNNQKHKWYYNTRNKEFVNDTRKQPHYTYVGEFTRAAMDFIAKSKNIPVVQYNF